MIRAAFKEQVYNSRSKCFEPCQIIVHYDNKQYHAYILSFDTEDECPHYVQTDTPYFRSESELQAHIRMLLGSIKS